MGNVYFANYIAISNLDKIQEFLFDQGKFKGQTIDTNLWCVLFSVESEIFRGVKIVLEVYSKKENFNERLKDYWKVFEILKDIHQYDDIRLNINVDAEKEFIGDFNHITYEKVEYINISLVLKQQK